MSYTEEYEQLKTATDKLENKFNEARNNAKRWAEEHLVNRSIRSKQGTIDKVISIEDWTGSPDRESLGLKVIKGGVGAELFRMAAMYNIPHWDNIENRLHEMSKQITINKNKLFQLRDLVKREQEQAAEETRKNNMKAYVYDENDKEVTVEQWKKVYDNLKEVWGTKRKFGESRPILLDERETQVFINAAVALRFADNQTKQNIRDGERDSGKDGDILYDKLKNNTRGKMKGLHWQLAAPSEVRTAVKNKYGVDLEEME